MAAYPDRLQATTAAIWARRLQTGHAALERARPQLEAALYGRALRTLRAWLGEPRLAIELTMIGPADERRIVRTANGVDVSLPFSWLSDVWMRGLAVTLGRLCLAAETIDGSSWNLRTLGPDLADVTELTIAAWVPTSADYRRRRMRRWVAIALVAVILVVVLGVVRAIRSNRGHDLHGTIAAGRSQITSWLANAEPVAWAVR